MRSEEYKAKHREREANRYREIHKDDTCICKTCGKSFLRSSRKGAAKTCSVECSNINKKGNDKNRCPVKKNLSHQRYVLKNADKLREWRREYRNSDNGKQKMAIAEKRPLRKLRKLMRTHLAREITKTKSPKIPTKELIDILSFDKECIVCGSLENLTIDHIIPLSRGGLNQKVNLQILCRKCNSMKNNKTMDEFLSYLSSRKTTV